MSIKAKLVIVMSAVFFIAISVVWIVAYTQFQKATYLSLQALKSQGIANANRLAAQAQLGFVQNDKNQVLGKLDKNLTTGEQITFIQIVDTELNPFITIKTGNVSQYFQEYRSSKQKQAVIYERDNDIVAVVPIQSEEGNSAQGYLAYVQSIQVIKDSRSNFITLTFFVWLMAIIYIGVSIWLMGNAIVKRIKTVTDLTQRFEDGDLTNLISQDSNDELGILSSAFNKMVLSFNNIVEQMRSSSAYVAAAAEQTSAVSEQITKGAERQVVSAESTSAAMEEMAASILGVAANADTFAKEVYDATSAIEEMGSTSELVAENADTMTKKVTEASAIIEQMIETLTEISGSVKKAKDLSEDSTKAAQSGGKAVMNALEHVNNLRNMMDEINLTIKKLDERSEAIDDIVTVIEEIADQTNLLALNAKIEAARAGDAGKGFAVVADEVGKLAERSIKATKNISEVLEHVQQDTSGVVTAVTMGSDQVNKGIALADKAGQEIQTIMSRVTDTFNLMVDVAMATEEQSAAAQHVVASVSAMTDITQYVQQATKEQAKGVMQVVSTTEQMNSKTEEIKNATAEQKIGGERVVQAMEEFNEIARNNLSAVHQLSSFASNMAEQARTLEDIVSGFKTRKESPDLESNVEETAIATMDQDF